MERGRGNVGGGGQRIGGGEPSYVFESTLLLGAALGGAALFGYMVVKFIFNGIHRFNDSLSASLRVSGGMRNKYEADDKLYHAILKVLATYMENDFRNRTVTVNYKQLQNGEDDYEFISPPGFGMHFVQYRGIWIKVERHQQPEVVLDREPFEYVTLSTYKWNKDILYNLLTEAKLSQRERDEKKTSFFCISCSGWDLFGEPKRRRPFDSVITSEGVKERLLGDVKDFLACEEWYMERGIPYRRGYLLYGPPGTGKSSLIRSIAGEIGYDICILSLSAKDLTDDDLNKLMNCTPEKSIILLEDADAAFKSREISTEDDCAGSTSHLAYGGAGASKVTFRGLLNALDGVASTEGRLIFITTNHIDKLDPALIRPGRTDVKILIDYPNGDQVSRMFHRFYPKAEKGLKNDFVMTLNGLEKKISMAEIQGLFLMFKESPEKAISHAAEYLNNEYFSAKSSAEVE